MKGSTLFHLGIMKEDNYTEQSNANSGQSSVVRSVELHCQEQRVQVGNSN